MKNLKNVPNAERSKLSTKKCLVFWHKISNALTIDFIYINSSGGGFLNRCLSEIISLNSIQEAYQEIKQFQQYKISRQNHPRPLTKNNKNNRQCIKMHELLNY